MRAACAELAELRSALVDGALNATDHDRVLAHLAGCAGCRRDVADLRAVHELVRRNAPAVVSPPDELARRLVSIAGAGAQTPLTSRNRRTGRRSRRPRMLRTAAVSAAVGVSLAAAGGVIGYQMAPAGPVAIADPSVGAEVELRTTLEQFPLNSGTLSGVVRLDPAPGGTTQAVTPVSGVGQPLSAEAVDASLQRTAAAAESVDFVGEQSFWSYAGGRTYTARARVVSQSARGSQVNVVSRLGGAGAATATVGSDVSRVARSARMSDPEGLVLLKRNFTLAGTTGVVVAGRAATVVQASRDGVLAARWWLDEATGLVLWQERFDESGHLQVSTGFTSLELTDRPDLVRDLPPGPAQAAIPTVTLSLAHARLLAASGWSCPAELAGLTLIRLRADRADDPAAVNLVLSDGLHTVSVHQQPGRLVRAPEGATWDASQGAYVRTGVNQLASWTSGGSVLTVVTDGPPELLSRAVASLPHEAVAEQTTMERIRAGWVEVLAG